VDDIVGRMLVGRQEAQKVFLSSRLRVSSLRQKIEVVTIRSFNTIRRNKLSQAESRKPLHKTIATLPLHLLNWSINRIPYNLDGTMLG